MRSRAKPLQKSHLFQVVVRYCPRTPGPYKYAVEVPALPGCFSDGRSRKEALDHVKEAIALYLTSRSRLPREDTELVEVTL